MKISYIITPFEDPEYLIRCVNSLYRQIGGSYEVILAENSFGGRSDELKRFLNEKRQIVRISESAESREDKIAEAAGLISEDSDYVMPVDVNTVVAPVAAQTILRCEKADWIVPAAAVRSGDEFLTDRADEVTLIRKIEQYIPHRVCFSRKIFADLAPELFREQKKSSYWIIEKLSHAPVIRFTEDICIYVENPLEEKEEKIGAGQLKAAMAGMADSFDRIENSMLRFGIADRLLCDFLKVLQKDKENGAAVYTEFRRLCEKCKDSPLLDRLVEMRTGCKPEAFPGLSLEEYELFRNLCSDGYKDTLLRTESLAVSDELLYKLDASLDKLHREITEIRTEQKRLMVNPPAPGYADPVRDIPEMCREGRLGFRTIWSCFKGWLGYKIGGEK